MKSTITDMRNLPGESQKYMYAVKEKNKVNFNIDPV